MTAGQPGMVLPPVGPEGVDRDCASWADVRVPKAFHVGPFEDRHPKPVGEHDGRLRRGVGVPEHQPSPCNPDGRWGHNRHLFDALLSEQGDVYEGDDLAPSAFEMTLTCVRCGLVKTFAGKLDPTVDYHRGGGERTRGFLDPVPLQAGPLLAQQITYDNSWGIDNAEWSIYRDGQLVGWIATERGPRGAHYVAGGLGRRHVDDHEVVKASTAIAVLRKLCKVGTLAPAGR